MSLFIGGFALGAIATLVGAALVADAFRAADRDWQAEEQLRHWREESQRLDAIRRGL